MRAILIPLLQSGLIEKDDKYHNMVNGRNVDSQPYSKEDLKNFLKKYHAANVLNRPGICFVIEHVLGKGSRGLDVQEFELTPEQEQSISWI